MSEIKVGMVQISPIWLDRIKTNEKILSYINSEESKSCDLLIFGEGLMPGYPYWLSFTKGSAFNNQVQKELFAHYLSNSVDIDRGDLDDICNSAKELKTAIYLGIIERAKDRGGHSLYCSLVYINKEGVIKSIHRKLQPTFEERLVWAQGDGHGLVTHDLGGFTLGGLNCWENWMPLSRTALYAQGENVHVGVWPGGSHNTKDLPQFIAKEGRCYSIHVCGLFRKKDIPKNMPHADYILENCSDLPGDGGSAIANPDGSWLIAPQIGEEGIYTGVLNINKVYQERQNFDPVGHYSRPDVTRLVLNQDRQSLIRKEKK
jgi:nitrilase